MPLRIIFINLVIPWLILSLTNGSVMALNALDYTTSGSGTVGDPWIGPAGRGGVQAAMNALPNEGGTVYMPDGYYSLTAAAIYLSPNSVLEGQSWDTVVVRSVVASYNSIIVMNDNTTLRNLKVDGNRYAQSIAIEGIRIEGRTNVFLDNVKFYNIRNAAVMLYSNTSNVMVENSNFENCYYGIHYNAATNISNVTIKGSYFTGDQNISFIYNIASNTSNLLIENNSIDLFKSFGIAIAETSNVTIRNNVIAGAAPDALPERPYWPSIHFEGPNSDNYQIVDNDVANPRHRGISIQTLSNNGIIRGNYIHDVAMEGIAVQEQANGTLIEDNIIENAVTGVFLLDGVDNTVIRNNEILSITPGWGIRTSPGGASLDNITIEGNYIHQITGDTGISLNNVAGNVIVSSNKLINNSGDGIYVGGVNSSSVEVNNNVIVNNAEDGIEIIGGAGGASIFHNTISGNSSDGIVLAMAGGIAEVKYNIVLNNNVNGIVGTGTIIDNYNIVSGNLQNYSGTAFSGPQTTFVAPTFRGIDYYSLADNSIALDAAAGSTLQEDVDGDPRLLDGIGNGSKISDIGADEYGTYRLKASTAAAVYVSDDNSDDLGDSISSSSLLKIGDEEAPSLAIEHRVILVFDGTSIKDSEVERARLNVYLDNTQYDNFQHVMLARVDGNDAESITDVNLYESPVLENYGIIIPAGSASGWYGLDISNAFSADINNKIIFRLEFFDEISTPNGDLESDLIEIRGPDFTEAQDKFAPYIDISLVKICPPYPKNDLNQDCIVNLVDFTLISGQWLECSAPACD